jgi:lipocalin
VNRSPDNPVNFDNGLFPLSDNGTISVWNTGYRPEIGDKSWSEICGYAQCLDPENPGACEVVFFGEH